MNLLLPTAGPFAPADGGGDSLDRFAGVATVG
jgi:hypothetical protein